MGFDNECIINIQSLKGEYFCPVCRLLVYPKEALQSQCSHLYCKPCLTYVVRTTQACPYDGYLVTEADAKPLLESNKVLADTIGKISVNCLFHRSGCTWQGQLADCTSHCSGCPFGDSSVMCNRCGVQIVHRQVEEHAQSCPGVQTQAPQSVNGQAASGAALNGPSTQTQTVTPTSAPSSQVQIASTASAAVQKSAQQVNPAAQSQAAQVAMSNTEQWYQQQQQYQQYYQQYPGYDPYQQQQYQQYYPYQQQPVQAVQQFQQPAQVYPSQLPGQQQAPSSQTVQQPQQVAQAPPTAQAQSHPPQQQTQQQLQPVGQPQALQNQVAYSAAQSQPQTYSQVQPYAHPQTGAVPHQGMQMLPYQQARPQMQQPPPPQAQSQPYAQPQAQQYPHPQSHLPAQTHPHPNSHTAAFQPPRPIQPMNHAGPLQNQNPPAHAVTGYQSYQQAQAPTLQQNQAGAPHSLHMNGLPQPPSNPSQFQGQFPNQPTQVRPSHISAMMPNQQPSNVHPQVQNTGASVAQVPAYQHSKHPGYLAQHHSGVQTVQHSSAQPQALPGSGPYMHQHSLMQAPANLQSMGPAYQQNSTHAAIQPNVRPMVSHGGGQQSYSQAPILANASQVLSNQLRTSQPLVNQSYPSQPIYGQELLRPSTADAHIMGKGKQETHSVEHGAGNIAGLRNAELSNTKGFEPKPMVGSDAKARVFEHGTQNGNMKIKEGNLDNAIELPSASNSTKEVAKENEQRSDKDFSNSALPPTSAAKQVKSSHSIPSSDFGRNQLGGPSPQHRFPPPGTHGGMIGGARPDFPEGSLSKSHPPNPIEGPGGFSDGRFPEFRHHGAMEQRPFGQTPSLLRLQDERMNMLPEEHLKPFPTDHSFGRRDFEGDLHKFPRPSHFEGGNSVKFGPRFPPPHDHGPHMFGDGPKPGVFRDVSLRGPGYPDFPRPVHGFGHHGSPGRDFRTVPTPGIGGFPHDIDGNDSHSYPPGKAFQQGRFPGVSGHLRRGEFDMQASDHMTAGLLKHSRGGDAIGQDMRLIHSRRGDFGPHNVHSRDGPGAFRGLLEMGDPPFPGSFLPPRPFAEPFGREMRGYLHHGEPGFKGHSMRFVHDDGFYRGEMEPFDNPRKRKPGSVMCRICSVDCETVEGLDLHSQTREHQKKAMDMVMSIKQQYSKKQKVSNQRNVLEEGRKNRTASFEGQGKKH